MSFDAILPPGQALLRPSFAPSTAFAPICSASFSPFSSVAPTTFRIRSGPFEAASAPTALTAAAVRASFDLEPLPATSSILSFTLLPSSWRAISGLLPSVVV